MTTFRIYVRWPSQRVSNKTTTEEDAVAKFAFDELSKRAEDFRQQGALGITLSADGKQVNYVRLAEG